MVTTRVLAALGCSLAVGLLVAGCGAGGHPGAQHSTTHATQTASPSGPSTTHASGTGATDKVVVLVVENHSRTEMSSGMPFTSGVAKRYGSLTDFRALMHPSLPNYLAMTGGDTFGVTDDGPPSENGFHGHSVFGQALAMGKTATLYAEGMPTPCSQVPGGADYAVKHNPWAYFVDERAQCQAHEKSLDALAGDVAHGQLPSAGMIIPNMCNDAHDCPLTVADGWLGKVVTTLTSGPDWKAGRLVVVITADEDDRSQDNQVLTVVMHPSLDKVVDAKPRDHYAITRLYDEILGAAPLGHAAGAGSLATDFALVTAAHK